MTTETYRYWHLGTLADSCAPGRCGNNFTSVFLKLILLLDIIITSCEIGLAWGPHNPIENSTSTLVKVMAWCRHATSHYMSQCWSSSMSPYGHWCHWPQWVDIIHLYHISIYHRIGLVWEVPRLRITQGFPAEVMRQDDYRMLDGMLLQSCVCLHVSGAFNQVKSGVFPIESILLLKSLNALW